MQRAVTRGLASLLILVGLIATHWDTAESTTLIRRSTAELTVLSEHVVEGLVTGVESRFHEGHQFVYTYVTVQIEIEHKGRLDRPTIVLEELGGQANGVTVTVPSTPEWAVGERVILFLDVKNDEYLRVHGMEQGKFTVITDDQTGRRMVTRPEAVDLTFNYSPDGVLDSTVDPATGQRDYDTFVRTIAANRDRLTTGDN